MVAALRQFVTVEAGGVVRVQSGDLREGDVAEVLVLTAPPTTPDAGVIDPSWEQFIGGGSHSGRTVEEVDASIRELRDEWDR